VIVRLPYIVPVVYKLAVRANLLPAVVRYYPGSSIVITNRRG